MAKRKISVSAIAVITFVLALLFRFVLVFVPDILAVVIGAGLSSYLKKKGRLKETNSVDYIIMAMFIIIFIIVVIISFYITFSEIKPYKLIIIGIIGDILVNFSAGLFMGFLEGIEKIYNYIRYFFITIILFFLSSYLLSGTFFVKLIDISNILFIAGLAMLLMQKIPAVFVFKKYIPMITILLIISKIIVINTLAVMQPIFSFFII